MKTRKISEVPVLEQATEKTNLLVEENGVTSRIPVGAVNNDIDPNRHAEYFDIDYYGVVSLKQDYRSGGIKINELPETIVIPEIIGNKAVAGLAASMFQDNKRVKEIVLPKTVDTIPEHFCNGAGSLSKITNTEHITTIKTKAFRNTALITAFFPNLKELGDAAFGASILLCAVDIGDTLTTIPTAVFANCRALSCVKGGKSVTTIGAQAFYNTVHLTTLPFLGQLTNIGKAAFQKSRINYDWDTLANCTFGDYATPIQDNTNKYWVGYEPTPCENPLVTKMCQRDPRWIDDVWGDTDTTYHFGCVLFSALHIHSALSGKQYATPMEFEAEVRDIDPTLMSQKVTRISYGASLLTALGYEVTYYGNEITAEIYQNMCEKLANGACVITTCSTASNYNGGHAVAIYGINEYGEMRVVDSDYGNEIVGIFDDLGTYEIAFQNMTPPVADFAIVERKQ